MTCSLGCRKKMGKWKKMNKDFNKDVLVCPNCKGIFVLRKSGCCPLCNMRLVYPGEGVDSEADAFIWVGEWKKVCDLEINPCVLGG